MSQPKKKVKKVVTSTKSTTNKTATKSASGKKTKKIKPTTSRTSSRAATKVAPATLVFKRQNFLLMGLGAALIAIGMLLMAGGAMPSPDVWDDSIIYSFRRTVLAPIVILAGLGVEIYAIFKKA